MNKTRFKHAKNRKVQYLDENGLWKSTGCDSLAEAKLWYEKNIISKKILFNDIAMDMFTRDDAGSYKWLCRKTNEKKADSWWYYSEENLKRRILPYFGDMDIRDIDSYLIQDWYFNLKKMNSNEELADETKNKLLNLVSTIMKWAKLNRIIESNPVDDVIRIKAETKKRGRFSERELEIMFPEEINAAVEFWGSLKWAAFFYMMIDTGWRPGEVAGFDIRGFYPEINGVYTAQSVDSLTNEVKHSIKTSNNGYEYKVGLLTDFTTKLIKLHIQQEDIKSGLVFTVNNEPIKINCTRLHYKRCMIRHGFDIKNRPPYSLRTTFMTRMANVYDEDTVKELMGHKQWHTCYDARTPEEMLTKLVAKIN